MALKAAEGKRNMLSIIDFFIQTLGTTSIVVEVGK
jgi:hypothetical protein